MHTPHPNQVIHGKDNNRPKFDIPQSRVLDGRTNHFIAQGSSFCPRGDTGRIQACLWRYLRRPYRAGDKRETIDNDREEEEDGQDVGDPRGLRVFEGEEEEEADGGPFVFGLFTGMKEESEGERKCE